MDDYTFGETNKEMEMLLEAYLALKEGSMLRYLEEEEFTVVIDYFDEQELLEEALRAAEIGLVYFPFSSELLVKYGDLLIAKEEPAAALSYLEQAEIYNPNDINIYILRVDALLALEREKEATEVFQHAITLFEGDSLEDLLFELSEVFDDYQDFEKVFDCIVLILKLDPTNEEALYKVCFWTDYTGRYEESIRLHQEIIEEHPYTEVAWFNLAVAYQGLKLYEKAVEAYLFATSINENFDFAYRNLGDVYIRLRKFDDAIEVLEKVVAMERADDILLEAIGHCHHRMNRYDEARKFYRSAIELHSEDSKLYYKVALTYIDACMWEQAIAPLQQAMQLQNAPEFHLALGECLYQMDQNEEAIQQFEIVVKIKSKNVTAWESLIRCYYEMEAFEEAHDCAQEALAATENKPIFRYLLALSLFAMSKNQEGLLQLEQALSENVKLFKKILEMKPSLLQNAKVVDLLSHYKLHKK